MKQKYFMKCCCKYWFYFVAGLVLAYILAAVVVDGNMIIGDAIDIMLSGEKEPECRQGEAGEEIELEYSGVNEEKEQRAAMSDNAEAIALENLTFHYREDKPLLKDFSL